MGRDVDFIHTEGTGVRQDFIDGIRGLAALYVVLHHGWLTIWPPGRYPTGAVMNATSWLMWGHFAVSMFIVVSGYCLMLPVVKRGRGAFSPVEFFKRRAQRILPPYYLAFALSAFLIWLCIGTPTGTHWDVVLPMTKKSVWRGLLLIPEIGGTINHVFWSIGVECKIYLAMPVILVAFRQLGVLQTAACISAIGFTMAYLTRDHPYWSLHYVGLFCWGGVAAFTVNSGGDYWSALRRSNVWRYLFGSGCLTATALLLLWGANEKRYFWVDFPVGIAAMSMMILAGRSTENPFHHVLRWRPMVSAGEFSYSIYLVHAPLLQVIWQYGIRGVIEGPVNQFLALTFGGVPLIVGASWVFYRFCEKPFIPSSRKMIERRLTNRLEEQPSIQSRPTSSATEYSR